MNNLKKSVIFKLIKTMTLVLVIMSLASCGGKSNVVGRWYSVESVYLKYYGCNCSSVLEIEEDSTFREQFFNDQNGELVRTDTGKWELEDNEIKLYTDGEELPSVVYIEGENLTSNHWVWEKR